MSELPPLLRHLPNADQLGLRGPNAPQGEEQLGLPEREEQPDPDALLEGFVDFTLEAGIEMYPAQEEAVLELLADNHVILNTPTGSGKSLVGVAAHFAALAAGKRSVYTAPIKALVSEKFFALCRDFGSERVGMITGDASVNPDAPIICCTAEILANWALRDGAATDVDVAVVDEFHFYGDPQRGWAWQVPLLELPHTQFLLMSATLGSTEFFERDLAQRSGRPVSLVQSTMRPVPLDFEYRRTTLHASIEELLERDLAPIYLVHFTQRDATEAAQSYLSLDPLNKEEKRAIKDAIGQFRFDSPIGADLKRYLLGGIGVHHAGLLPKYRLLVERLAQDGLLKIICGTDTLGVGVNVPIRSVLFTQLCKYDGISTRTLRNREFAQIAGRAGRKGFDDRGTVWVQAPEHVVDNLRAEEKAAKNATGGKKPKKVVKKKQPDRGYAHWTEDTFTKMVNGAPEALRSHFRVNHQMVMSLLDRPADDDGVDGCDAVRRLMVDNHESRKRQRGHIRRSIAIYRSLVEADLLEFPPEPDDLGRKVRVNFDLQDEFALHQPLSLWAIEAIEQRLARESFSIMPTLPPKPEPRPADTSGIFGELSGLEFDDDGPDLDDDDSEAELLDPIIIETAERETDLVLALDLLTIIESVMENPGVVIAAQVDRAKSALMAEMKSSGVEYEERMERLAEVRPPQPNREWLYASFDGFRSQHPWVDGDNVRPKSIARDLFEQAMTFSEYVHRFGLKRSEGVLLRYLSDVYKGLRQNIPEEAKTDELDDLIDWLGAVVRQVDSSLISEWERMQAGLDISEEAQQPIRPPSADDVPDWAADAKAVRVLVRNTMFRWVQNLAFGRNYTALASAAHEVSGLDTSDAISEAVATYWDEHDSIITDAVARSGEYFIFDPATGKATQILLDPAESGEWRIEGMIDRLASDEAGELVMKLTNIRAI